MVHGAASWAGVLVLIAGKIPSIKWVEEQLPGTVAVLLALQPCFGSSGGSRLIPVTDLTCLGFTCKVSLWTPSQVESGCGFNSASKGSYPSGMQSSMAAPSTAIPSTTHFSKKSVSCPNAFAVNSSVNATSTCMFPLAVKAPTSSASSSPTIDAQENEVATMMLWIFASSPSVMAACSSWLWLDMVPSSWIAWSMKPSRTVSFQHEYNVGMDHSGSRSISGIRNWPR